MTPRRCYRRKPDKPVAAVQLALETAGFSYQKWGAEQRCKPGDWLVDNDGDIYSVDRETFERTYERSGLGVYVKISRVWAEVATEAGSVPTQEGRSHYEVGDYIVWNDEAGQNRYCMSAEKFDSLYEPDD